MQHILTQEEYKTLKQNISDKDRQIKQMRELINSNDKFIILGKSLSEFIKTGYQNNYIVDFNYLTPQEFKDESQKILNQFKIAFEKHKKEFTTKKSWKIFK